MMTEKTHMFIAMNRFRVAPSKEKDFENIWKSPKSYLEDVSRIFRSFTFFADLETSIERYTRHTRSGTPARPEACTKSDMFKVAHSQVRAPEGVYLGPPELETFEVIL